MRIRNSYMGELDQVINGDERVLWRGRPALLPFFASTLLSVVLGTLLLLGILLFAGANLLDMPDHIFALVFLSPFLLVALALAVAFPLYRILVYANLSYAITNKRVLLHRGIIAKDVLMLDFDQISNASVKIDFPDVFLGFGQSGSVLLTTSGSLGPDVIDPVDRLYRPRPRSPSV